MARSWPLVTVTGCPSAASAATVAARDAILQGNLAVQCAIPLRRAGGLDAEARAIQCGLRIQPVIGQGDDHLHVPLRLHEAAHHAEGADE